MIGREREQQILFDCMNSGRPEFLAVYGRRRIGKTFLIKEYFQETFSFYSTGVPRTNTRQQLKYFFQSLKQYGDEERTIPKDWLEAFSRLRKLLSSPAVQRDFRTGRRVVFLDELPWMDTVRSDFKGALDYFWNSWASTQKDLILIVCGSATSWIISNLILDTGGFYNRITQQIHLQPFNLHECELLLQSNNMPFTRKQIIECYMIFGGIPQYLNFLKPQFSLAQNVDMLCFQENAPLRHEYQQLLSSLFKNPDHHRSIIEALSTRKSGLSRAELSSRKGIPDGKTLTKCLEELEQCGFIRKYNQFQKESNGAIYQLIDAFTLFHLTWIQSQKTDSWLTLVGTPTYYTWCGLSFERICLLHTKQIKNALGILGVSTQECSWRSTKSIPGAQIDLLIDRKDDAINLCEMKYSNEEYVIDAAYEKELLHKVDVLRAETKTPKAILPTMITFHGVKNNTHKHVVVQEITSDSLFKELL